MKAVPRDAERSRATILDAAEAAFARSGFEGASFSEICEAAGVSRGLPSYLFGNKEQLYRAVVERSAEQLRASTIEPLRRQSKTLTLEKALDTFVDTYVDYLAKHRNIVRLLQWEMVSDLQSSRPFAPTTQLFSELYDIFKEVIARSPHAAVDASELLASIVALCFFPFALRVKHLGMESDDKATLRRHKRRILRLLTEGIYAK